MNPEIIKTLITAGLVTVQATIGEATAALKAFAKARGKDLPEDLEADAAVEAVKQILASQQQEPADPPAPPAPEPPAQPPAADSLHAADIIGMINLTSLSAEQRLELQTELLATAEQLTMNQVMDRINQVSQEQNPPAGATPPERITAGEAERDKFQAAARDAILARTWGAGNRPKQIFNYQTREMEVWEPGANVRNYGMMSLPKLAQQCLLQAGVSVQNVFSLSGMDIARMMMGANPHSIGLGGMFAASDGPAYNVSGMFSNILLDVANVMLRRSYDDGRTTFQAWMRQAPSIEDFKPVNKVIAGELGDPQAVPEDGEFEETTLTDGKETYKLTIWGQIFSHSWQLIQNDRLNSFTEIPIKMGRGMRRKQNRLAYGVIKDNAALADGNALFDNTNHSNDTTGVLTTLADYVTAWNTVKQKMREQTGLDADSAALNFEPAWGIFPPALEGIIRQLLESTSSDPNNPNVKNIWRNGVNPVYEAEIGLTAGGSDTAHYLATDSNEVDTIEYAYLQGLETPVIEQEVAFDRLALKQRIYQAFAVAAIDHRGLQRHTGAA